MLACKSENADRQDWYILCYISVNKDSWTDQPQNETTNYKDCIQVWKCLSFDIPSPANHTLFMSGPKPFMLLSGADPGAGKDPSFWVNVFICDTCHNVTDSGPDGRLSIE